MKPKSPEESDAMVVSYLDGSLTPDERAEFEKHLAEDSELSSDMGVLTEITSALKTCKEEVFCPELWELHEYARTGNDPGRRIGEHLESCDECREAVAEFHAGPSLEKPMPANIRDTFKADSAVPVPPYGPVRDMIAAMRERLAALFSVPMMALGTVAAAVLLVVILYPSGELGPTLALSPVAWEKTGPDLAWMGRPGPAPQDRPKLAVLMFLAGFDQPVPRERIDAFYEALKPDADQAKRFDAISPGRVKDLIERTKPQPAGLKEVLALVDKDLKAAMALVLEVRRKKADEYSVECRLLAVPSGETLRSASRTVNSGSALPEALKAVSILTTDRGKEKAW